MQPKHITWGFMSIMLVLYDYSSFAQQSAMEDDIIKISGITSSTQVYPLTSSQKQTTVVYYDGFNRPIQQVAQNASPLQADMIQPIVYDNLGRQTIEYLPYADEATGTGTIGSGNYRSTALTEQSSFYNQTSQYLIARDADPFQQQMFENSPLQRLLQVGQMGAGFQPITGPHFKTINYRPNSYSLDGNVAMTGTTGTFTTFYPDNTLWVTDGKDEDSEETLIYKDITGHVVLKRQLSGLPGNNQYFDTYYIYNNAGTVAYIVPPKATYSIMYGGNTISTPSVANLIYSYSYNSHGQIISKTASGSGLVSIIYDPLNRPVLAQDVNNAALNQWYYIKYDVKGRVAIVGTYVDGMYTSPGAMQAHVSGLTYATWYESRTTSATYYYYTNNVFPTTNFSALNYSYYDNYNWTNDGTTVISFTTPTPAMPTTGTEGQAIPVPAATKATIKGTPTITLTQTVGPGLATSMLILKVIFYDNYGRPIQTRSNNQLYYSLSRLTDSKTAAIDFSGKTMATQLTVKNSSSTTNTILTTFNYDSGNRLADVDQVYNSQPLAHISHYNYNEIGQLVSKNLGGINWNQATAANIALSTANSVSSGQTLTETATNSVTMSPNFSAATGSTFKAQIGGGYLQTVNMRYNIRGQLLSINNPTLTNDGGMTSNESTDLFGMQLFYDGTDSKLGTTYPSYTGKISAVEWMTRNGSNAPTNERSYVYAKYDPLGRYTGSKYAELAPGQSSFSTNVDGFDENNITYDDGGNILSMNRNSSSIGANSYMQVDDLVYHYDSTQPNMLNTVTDGIGTNYTSLGFRNYTGSAASYVYDNEGNLTTDPYKALNLTYTASINRAITITQTASGANGAYVGYTYDGLGNVMHKQVYTSSTVLQSTTDYINGLVFTTTGSTTVLSYFAMPEGRVLNSGTAFIPEYVITDQQGNARFSFADNGNGGVQIRQENSFYPTGENLAVTTVPLPPPSPAVANINLYNGGSEWQNEFNNLLDYHQTFFRNYDPAIGRFIASDPEPESAESMTTYQYAGDNPVMDNDPLGNFREGTGPRPPRPHLPSFFTQNSEWGAGEDIIGNSPTIDPVLLSEAQSGDPDAVQEYAENYGATIIQNGKIVNNNNVSNTTIQSLVNTTLDYLNGHLNSQGIELTSSGIHWTSLTLLPSTPFSQEDIKEFGHTQDDEQTNFLVNWNFISYGDLASNAWNSPAARAAFPDVLSVNYGGVASFGWGKGFSGSLDLITRGPQAGIYATYTTSKRVGFELDYGISASEGWFVGPVSQITLNSFLGAGADGVFSYGESFGNFVSAPDENGNGWFGFTVGKVGLGGTIGLDNTSPIPILSFPAH